MFLFVVFVFFEIVFKKNCQIVFSRLEGWLKMCRTDSRDEGLVEMQPGALSDWKTSGPGDLAVGMVAHRD